MWAQLLSAVLGLWLMAAPGIFDYGNPAENNHHIIGPMAATFAIIAIWEVTRALRWLNLLLGAWLLLAPWVLSYDNSIPTNIDLVTGGLLIIFSLVKGKRSLPFGGGWSVLWESNSPPKHEGEN